jgi:phosphopentomutase
MARAFIFVLDSFGIGGSADAALYGDEGANTFGHIAQACAAGRANRDRLRTGPLQLPNMLSLGLARAAEIASGLRVDNAHTLRESCFYGAAQEISRGKDTPSGHWEIAGLPALFDWGYFSDTIPAFPAALTEAMIREGNVPGILANRHAPGIEAIESFGEKHIRTGMPICYTSVDSVLQVAAHEDYFGLERLYDFCKVVRRLCDPLHIGRVIARPFVGEAKGAFKRTPNRKDYAVPPPEPTLLDRLAEAGSHVFAIGKIGDIFAHRGISEVRKAPNNMAMFDIALDAIDDAREGDFVFANFVDFDTEFGHQRDVAGYAAALEAFDQRVPEALAKLKPGDLFILSADHGNDPTWQGTDHTRERIPIIGVASGMAGGDIGLRPTYSDIGETVAAHLGIAPGRHGASFHTKIGGHA